jgi:NAD(P)-dependent dehydrogenase (short-subunit alcohol dehydrogenase family)
MLSDLKMPDFKLKDKTAIVTGATKGLGYATAVTLAKSGANVVITSRTQADCERCSDEFTAFGLTCIGIPADSSKKEDIDRVVNQTVQKFGAIDILINNAGISGKTAALLEQTEENFSSVIDVNLKGVFLFAQAVAAQMVKQGCGGKIINVASVGGLIGGKGLAPYGASKAGVISLTRTMANEWARYGINVNAICPGYVVTELNREFFNDPVFKEKMAGKIPLRRVGSVEEIAGPILAMASGCFDYMTGATLVIDGGQTIGG